jgi:hypothetical protein
MYYLQVRVLGVHINKFTTERTAKLNTVATSVTGTSNSFNCELACTRTKKS